MFSVNGGFTDKMRRIKVGFVSTRDTEMLQFVKAM